MIEDIQDKLTEIDHHIDNIKELVPDLPDALTVLVLGELSAAKVHLSHAHGYMLTDETAKEKDMDTFIVLYRTKYCAPADPPFGMRFTAEDSDHAEEQLYDAEPDAAVVWVVQTTDYQRALENYWNEGLNNDSG